MSAARARVLVVDDSPIARDLLALGLSRDPEIEVVGKAGDAYEARDKIVALAPDVATLDVEMPRMDGIEFLRRLLPQYPLPVIVVSGLAPEGSRRALEALEAGAAAVVAKPRADGEGSFAAMLADLSVAIKEAARARRSGTRRAFKPAWGRSPPAPPVRRLPDAKGFGVLSAGAEGRILAIGASTGGTSALGALIPSFPPTMPGTLIVQHMPPVFTKMFADSLSKVSQVEVREARTGDRIAPGLVLVAPGDLHLRLSRQGPPWSVTCTPGPKVSGHRPSVDVLFSSVAEGAGEAAVGLLLTGMGRDGAAGLLAMRRSGARCLAQDEASSVVFGMPKEAWDLGAAERLVSLDDALEAILSCLGVRVRAGKGA